MRRAGGAASFDKEAVRVEQDAVRLRSIATPAGVLDESVKERFERIAGGDPKPATHRVQGLAVVNGVSQSQAQRTFGNIRSV